MTNQSSPETPKAPHHKPKSAKDLDPSKKIDKKQITDSNWQLEKQELLDQIKNLEERKLYLGAEIQNINRKHEIDLRHTRNTAVTKFSLSILPVLESLEHALLTDVNAGQELRTGIENTLTMFQSALQQNNIKTIDPIGEQFDPHFHEAMTTGNNPELPDNQIISVLQKGFTYGDHVLRHARVIINKPQPEME